MSRSQPYRNRIPIQLLKIMDVTKRITLFMVGQSGPLSFTFQDRLGNKIKTSIGTQVKCSCCPGKNDHCIHTLYVLLRVFKISPQNPLIWQAGYIDSQLSDLVSGKYTIISNQSIIRPNFQYSQDILQQLPSVILSQKPTKKYYKIQSQQLVQQLQINQDSICPICQQQITSQQCLSYCKIKCGNNFHLQCLKIWVQHKSTNQSSITCPMCRCTYEKNYLQNLQFQQKQYHKNKQNKPPKIKYKCSNCLIQQIPKNVHKCLLCTSYQLCQVCYLSNKHLKHPFIRQVQNNQNKWCGAQQRRKQQIKIKKYIDIRKKQKKTNQLLLQKFHKIQQNPNKILDFITSTYPYVSKYISQNIDPFKKLQFNHQDLKCMKCSSKKITFLRRLTCGHFIDHQCLKENFIKAKFYCDQCGSKLVKGYENLLMRQQQLQQQVQQYQPQKIQISQQFNPSTMQNPDPQDKYNFITMKRPSLAQVIGGRMNWKKQHSDITKAQKKIQSSIIKAQVSTASRPNSSQHNPQIRVLHRNKSTSEKTRFQEKKQQKNSFVWITNLPKLPKNNRKTRAQIKTSSIRYRSNGKKGANSESLQIIDHMMEGLLGKKIF